MPDRSCAVNAAAGGEELGLLDYIAAANEAAGQSVNQNLVCLQGQLSQVTEPGF